MKSTIALAAVLASALAAPAFAAPESYTLDSRHTFPVFEINHLGFSLQRGRFNKTEGKIVIDRAAKTGSVELAIEAASIDMGIAKWDEHMVSEDFFNAAQFPTITFKSTKVTFQGDKVVGADGDFTLLGVTKPIKVAFAGFACGDHPMNKKPLCGGNATATIKRSDFGMTKYLPGIADEVKIYVPIEAFKD
ncbi:MAG: YceI family protein [Burkholderiales bacterium]|nr:YceI family protein [Burkholderiales bacterium]